MKKYYILFCLSFLFFTKTYGQNARYVVLITIDGFRPEFYKNNSWGTPNLHQLISKGSYADGVTGVFPTVTFPSHTTIITGARPAKHGIHYNTPFEPEGETGRWYWEYNAIQIPTLFTAVRNAGLSSAAIQWPVTVGAPIDYNVPENKSLLNKNDKITPVKHHTTPKGFYEEIEQNATGKLSNDDLNVDFLVFDENLARMAAYVIKTYKPAFTAVHLPCVDHAQHVQGLDGNMVRAAVAGADHSIGRILEALQQAGIRDSTAIIIVGDHGFSNIHTSVSPNVWLQQRGIKVASDSKGSWKARFHVAGASAFLMLKDPDDRKSLTEVYKVIDQLPPAERKLFRLIEKSELDRVGADPAAQLALAAVPGVAMNSSIKEKAINPASGGTHGFYPDFKDIQTGFIASGAGIAKGVVIPQMGLEDVAPLIAQLLGLKYTAPDGILFPGLLSGK